MDAACCVDVLTGVPTAGLLSQRDSAVIHTQKLPTLAQLAMSARLEHVCGPSSSLNPLSSFTGLDVVPAGVAAVGSDAEPSFEIVDTAAG